MSHVIVMWLMYLYSMYVYICIHDMYIFFCYRIGYMYIHIYTHAPHVHTCAHMYLHIRDVWWLHNTLHNFCGKTRRVVCTLHCNHMYFTCSLLYHTSWVSEHGMLTLHDEACLFYECGCGIQWWTSTPSLVVNTFLVAIVTCEVFGLPSAHHGPLVFDMSCVF